jgi:thiamine biosynthesis protein ThiS
MKVFIERENKTKEIKFSGNVKQLLDKLKILSEEVIVSRNDEIVTLDDNLKEKDNVKVLSVISGG